MLRDDVQSLKEELTCIIEKFSYSYSAKIKSDKEILHTVYVYNSFLPENIELKTRVY